ncbi:hypothetical protein R2A130_3601 [Ahrensia sp. R2A130]|nr:hypothetical protein R2A130_3601 [Ahrensia sp. R2A130]
MRKTLAASIGVKLVSRQFGVTFGFGYEDRSGSKTDQID